MEMSCGKFLQAHDMSPSSSSASSKKIMTSCCSLLLLLCLVLSQTAAAAAAAEAFKVVTHLPGFQGPLPFYLETGYVEVDEQHDGSMFYYFIESERDPAEDPLVLWLTGGPGCSGLSALLYEIGPLSFNMQSRSSTVPTLAYRADSWTKVSNIIFIDAPINAGFSYCREGDAYHSSDTQMASQILEFLRKWLDNHNSFKNNPLYIAGDSYAGLIVPVVASKIANEDEFSNMPFFNLKGYVVGNPVTDDNFETNAQIPFAHGMGLISDELYECVKDINKFHILEADYPLDSTRSGELYARVRRELSVTEENAEVISSAVSTIPSRSRYFGYLLSPLWANSDAVRLSLGIREGSISKWKRCKRYDASWYTRDIESAVPYHLILITRGYRALVYSGDHDMVVPYLATQAWIRQLDFSIVDEWRPWYVTGQVAGYTRMYSNNLTFATVKGAGHTAPEFRPKECFAMFQRWLDQYAL
ncbi:serine carboxypeptidase-like 13 isoform X2 [Brachypodium distachyon]|uniref:serine carboxypeptidase-like 13 isoform X2 n=1 Tax=Brachypodium distachyon TaxID=15368 RepID=UPI00052FEA09|nr:serine carboxypeptidase-like 13 isoform X2 [Brachypodium distachyon]|eukprot:XP_024314264.1 serine carboxypeptidase-like 13 isoform X2 [Brachypodium distachyon]